MGLGRVDLLRRLADPDACCVQRQTGRSADGGLLRHIGTNKWGFT